MRIIALLLSFSIISNTVVLPLAVASENRRQLMRNGSVDVDALRSHLAEIVMALDREGWRFESPSRERIEARSFVTGAVTDFFLLPPSSLTGADFLFRLRVGQLSGAVRIAATAYDRSGAQVLSRRTFAIDHTVRSGEEARIAMERTLLSMENDIHSAIQANLKPQSLWRRLAGWLLPSAYAEGEHVVLRRVLRVIFVVGAFPWVYILLGGSVHASGRAGVVIGWVFLIGLVLVIGSWATDFIVTGAPFPFAEEPRR